MKFELNKVIPTPLQGTSFSDKSVWNNTLTFSSPEKILLNARSGKGKSTFIHVLYGLRTDFEGEVTINGKPIAQLSLHDWIEWRRTDLSFIPQDLQLFPSLSVMDNLRLKNKLTNHSTEAEILELLTRLGIGDKKEQTCGTLSMGQQQRVAIIRALLQPFRFLLMDEPFSHLDETNTDLAMALINEKTTENKAGYVLTSLGSGHNNSFTRELMI